MIEFLNFLLDNWDIITLIVTNIIAFLMQSPLPKKEDD